MKPTAGLGTGLVCVTAPLRPRCRTGGALLEAGTGAAGLRPKAPEHSGGHAVLRRTYDAAMRLAETRYALWVLAAMSFVESSVFPLPPDILLIPMVLARPDRAWLIAGVCTVSSVVGGFAGYAIGLLLYDTIGQPVLAFYGYLDKFTVFQDLYNEWGAWIVAGAGITPFPYKVITIASGVTQLDPVVFGVASVVSRGLRFFLVAALLWKWGAPMRVFIEKRLGLLVTVGFVLLLGGFLALKLV